MRRFLPLILFLFSILLNQTAFADSFISFKDKVIAIKIDMAAAQQINPVKFSRGFTGVADVDVLNKSLNVARVQRYFKLSKKFITERNKDLNNWLLIYFKSSIDPVEISKKYKVLSDVIKAEAIPINKVYKTPNDLRYSDQWHINQSNDADIDAPEGWDLATGDPAIIVAVLDTGVEWWHVDLAGAKADKTNRLSIGGNIWINKNELNNTYPTVDEDGNGYNDDWVGWDFVTGNPQFMNLGDDYDVADNDPSDGEGHGTHCAGNVSAINDNGTGVCSAAGGWGEDANGEGNGVKIMALRIGWSDFPSGRVSMDFAAQAFTYAAENGAKIASCSWGSSQTGALEDAVNTFLYGTTSPTSSDPKIRLIFVAAGNDGNENQNYLNSRDDVVSVAATDENDNAASFTSYGTWVDISAPGNNILSTYKGGGYTSLSGTSMATPITASVAALIWSDDTALNAEQVENYLYQGADNIDSHLDSKYIGKMGAGRVSAYGSLSLVPVNHAPLAVADTSLLAEDDSSKIAVLANDYDADGDPLSFRIIDSPLNGQATQIGDTIHYQPNANFFGKDSFRYELSDSRGGLDTAMVRVTVTSVNDAPEIVGLPDDLFLTQNNCTSLYMANYAQDVDTPDSLLTWSFSVNDPTAISYSYDTTTDSLEICSLGPIGVFYLYTTLTDDSGAYDQDTIAIHVDKTSGIEKAQTGMPKKYNLMPNFPNPFNPITTIRYQLPRANFVTINVFNMQGQLVSKLVEKFHQAGYYQIKFDGRQLASGIYFCKMKAGKFVKIHKMALLK